MTRLQIGRRDIGAGIPTYVIAELSANHGQRYDQTEKPDNNGRSRHASIRDGVRKP